MAADLRMVGTAVNIIELHPFAIEHPASHRAERYDDYQWEQWKFVFGNGYGASVVRGTYTYGGPALWELAVLGVDGHLVYSTEITDDVIGWLDETAVSELLERIARLA